MNLNHVSSCGRCSRETSDPPELVFRFDFDPCPGKTTANGLLFFFHHFLFFVEFYILEGSSGIKKYIYFFNEFFYELKGIFQKLETRERAWKDGTQENRNSAHFDNF